MGHSPLDSVIERPAWNVDRRVDPTPMTMLFTVASAPRQVAAPCRPAAERGTRRRQRLAIVNAPTSARTKRFIVTKHDRRWRVTPAARRAWRILAP